jgi:uncharacterized protein (DUF58 family)
MIVPGRLALVLALLLSLVLVAAVVLPGLVLFAAVADGAIVAAVLAAGWRLRRLPVTVAGEWPRRLQIGRPAQLVYRIENRGKTSVLVKLRQVWPDSFEADTDTVETLIRGGEIVRVALRATPRVRGPAAESVTEVQVRFATDLARRRWQVPSPPVTVYPNLKGVADYERLRRHHAAAQAGIHQLRIVGSGREFDQLRDYQADDDYRDISWKATAHHGYPITTVYRAERSQEVLVCLDCGRMMGNPVGRGTALDCAVDAGIMLGHVANRQGDRVGLVLFRDLVERFVQPAGGLSGVNRMVEVLVGARPQRVFPSYAALVEALRTRQKRRSMVFLFTDLNDPQLSLDLAGVLPLVSRRHLVVVISLRDALLEKVAAGPAEDAPGLYRVLAARELATERAQHTLSLVRAGVQVLEADADALSLDVVNAYLRLKARQLL